jgi:uncharacterized C2H2 Zn-finger protein
MKKEKPLECLKCGAIFSDTEEYLEHDCEGDYYNQENYPI